jgi:hypothetical protein
MPDSGQVGVCCIGEIPDVTHCGSVIKLVARIVVVPPPQTLEAIQGAQRSLRSNMASHISIFCREFKEKGEPSERMFRSLVRSLHIANKADGTFISEGRLGPAILPPCIKLACLRGALSYSNVMSVDPKL